MNMGGGGVSVVTMKAMEFASFGSPLQLVERPMPLPQANEILLELLACGVCRTDRHIVVDGYIKGTLPIAPDHEVSNAS